MQNNPVICNPGQPNAIWLAQTRDTLLDTDIYLKFVYKCTSTFYSLPFYKDYKSSLMRMGLNRDAHQAGINADMADIELHHHFPTLKQATIMLTEHSLNTKGCVTTFEVIDQLVQAHRNNWLSVIMLSKTQHQVHHANPADFISLKQCAGDGFEFISRYLDGITLDIAYNMLLQLKQEEQYGGSFTPEMVKGRDDILSWTMYQQV
jgi:hypothetical protein